MVSDWKPFAAKSKNWRDNWDRVFKKEKEKERELERREVENESETPV